MPPALPSPAGVEHALYRAKVWSKYAKDVIAYIEKRAQLDLDHCRALTKLAHVTRPALKDEVSSLPQIRLHLFSPVTISLIEVRNIQQ